MASFILSSSKEKQTLLGSYFPSFPIFADILKGVCSSSFIIIDKTSLIVFISKSRNTVTLIPSDSAILSS